MHSPSPHVKPWVSCMLLFMYHADSAHCLLRFPLASPHGEPTQPAGDSSSPFCFPGKWPSFSSLLENSAWAVPSRLGQHGL